MNSMGESNPQFSTPEKEPVPEPSSLPDYLEYLRNQPPVDDEDVAGYPEYLQGKSVHQQWEAAREVGETASEMLTYDHHDRLTGVVDTSYLDAHKKRYLAFMLDPRSDLRAWHYAKTDDQGTSLEEIEDKSDWVQEAFHIQDETQRVRALRLRQAQLLSGLIIDSFEQDEQERDENEASA